MSITERFLKDNSIEVSIKGRLDTNTAPQVETRFKEISGNFQCIHLNLSEVEYISSAGLRVILLAHKLMLTKGGLVIKSPSAFCQQVFEATGMNTILFFE